MGSFKSMIVTRDHLTDHGLWLRRSICAQEGLTMSMARAPVYYGAPSSYTRTIDGDTGG
jgi:hypothetical protein